MEQKYFKETYQKKVKEINESIEKKSMHYAMFGVSNLVTVFGALGSLYQALEKNVPQAICGTLLSIIGLGMAFYSRQEASKQDRKIKEKFSELESTLFHEEDNIPFG